MVSLPMHVSESGDEGLGSMSPEPLSVITVTTEGHSVVNSEVVELRRQLERERHARLHLEKQMRAIQSQLYPERFRDNQLITYQPHEVKIVEVTLQPLKPLGTPFQRKKKKEKTQVDDIYFRAQVEKWGEPRYEYYNYKFVELLCKKWNLDVEKIVPRVLSTKFHNFLPAVLQVIEHTDNVIAQETEEAVAALQVVSVVSLAPVGTTQTVETSSPDPSSPPLSPQPADMVPEEIKEEEAGPGSPKIVTFGQNQVFSAIDEQTTGDSSFSSSSRVTYATSTGEFKNASPQYITTSPSRPFSPAAEPQRLPSVLEAAMKAEPKVEVER